MTVAGWSELSWPWSWLPLAAQRPARYFFFMLS